MTRYSHSFRFFSILDESKIHFEVEKTHIKQSPALSMLMTKLILCLFICNKTNKKINIKSPQVKGFKGTLGSRVATARANKRCWFDLFY